MTKLLFAAVSALLAISPALGAEPAAEERTGSLTEWLTRTRTLQARYSASIPAPIRAALAKSHPEFLPLSFDNADRVDVARGDFNCDGKEDYALTGVARTSELARAFQETKPTPARLQELAKAFDSYAYGEAAVVMVALSASHGILWKQEMGTYVRNSGVQCGCCGGISKAQQQSVEQQRCSFLYIGCCEKDGTYLIYEKDSTAVKFEGGC